MTSPAAPKTSEGRGAPSLRREFRARAHRSCVPVKAMLEVTRHCNLRCVHCYVADRDRGELPLSRWLELVDELADEGCFSVSLTGGEVGLREGWLDVAAAVKRRRMILGVLTSGTAFTSAELQRLIELRPAQVAVSLYGATAERHDAVTRVRGSFEKSVATLNALTAAGISCRVGSVLMTQTIDSFVDIARLARDDLGCSFMFDPTVAPCDDGSCDVTGYRVEADRLREFYLNELIVSRSREGKVAAQAAEPSRDAMGNCGAGFTTLFVEAGGDVYPCMGFPPSLGSVASAPLREVWRSEAAREHRTAMERPLNSCATCSLSAYCTTRCPRLALVEDGDMSGPSKRACELARLTVEMREQLHGGPRYDLASSGR